MNGENDHFRLEIPLDASEIEDFQPDRKVKVAVRDAEGRLQAQTTGLDPEGHGRVTFSFEDRPGPLSGAVGPADASDEELFGLQTLNFTVSPRQWREAELTLEPLRIPSYYWFAWLRWCRTFTIRGRVVCPDGSPVPGADVCAFDVDWWFFWSSKQLVGCATTDVNGTFTLTFRWCCGWWPWWWWRHRVWQLDPGLIERVRPVLQRAPELQLARVGNQPSLEVFGKMLAGRGERGMKRPGRLQPADVSSLDDLRKRLLVHLPSAPELERLQIWPWWPWRPWLDCTPDIVFRVTQDCDGAGTVVLDEGTGDTRWNIPDPLTVTLVVGENACCRPEEPPPTDRECLIIDQVCNVQIDQIGGNLGAPASPVGYAHPSPTPPGPTTIDTDHWDRPFAEGVPIHANPNALTGVDYYELEVHDGSKWLQVETGDPGLGQAGPPGTGFPGAVGGFKRRYFEPANPSPFQWADFPTQTLSGHLVLETRGHYETSSPLTFPDEAGATDAWWLSTNWNLLVPLDSRVFPDGAYRFRVIGWDDAGGGTLGNPRVLPVCGTDDENELVLTFDNRVWPDPAHPASHPCGSGFVHLCTTEPDTHILDVRINGTSVGPCDTVDATTGTLEIDFLAHDPDGHLAAYELRSAWGLNHSRRLLDRPGVSLTILSGAQTGWYSGQSSGNYGTALDQGATAPTWHGGRYLLTMPVVEAFPEPCCYQLELEAWKRTIICGHQRYRNETEYTLGVGVCGPEADPAVPDVEERGVRRRADPGAVR